MKKINILLISAVIFVVFATCGYFISKYVINQPGFFPLVQKCGDGSLAAPFGPDFDFISCPGNILRTSKYGFEITVPGSWKDYNVERKDWEGIITDVPRGEGPDYNGPMLIIKNPQTTATQIWQDIPIMVFAHDVWNLVEQEKVSVSAAPIGPAKIGENSKYVFATPPRWYGFTDAMGWQEAVDIVKTFKTF